MRTLLTTSLVCALPFTSAIAQQVPPPKTAADMPSPPGGTLVTKAYVEGVGRMAYLWGWPLVNLGNRSVAFSKVTQPFLDQDVVYGFGLSQLEIEPMVLQVPDFGDRFRGCPLDDERTDEFSAVLRVYGPGEAEPTGQWNAPALERVK